MRTIDEIKADIDVVHQQIEDVYDNAGSCSDLVDLSEKLAALFDEFYLSHE